MVAGMVGLFGLVIGSFLNVVILRHGAKNLGGRSECSSCRHVLAWYDLLPVLSWLTLRGRCRYCGSRISGQYAFVELSTALLFVFLWTAPVTYGIPYKLIGSVAIALLVCIFVYDLRHTIIPNLWVYTFDVLAIILSLLSLSAFVSLKDMALPQFLAGFLAAAPLFFLWAASGGRWMGFGDVKLALGMGWLLGPLPGLFSVLFAFVLGSIIMVPLLLYGRAVTHTGRYLYGMRGLTMKSEVPFGPFLVASTLLVWLSFLHGFDIPAIARW